MNLLDLQPAIVYGPVQSRRLGRSLGINLLPTTFKVCSLNCVYCQYGWTKELAECAEKYREYLPSVPEVIQAVEQALKSYDNLDFLTFSGNGEPTLHPDFADIVEGIENLKEQTASKVKMALLSNSSTCWQSEIVQTLGKVDLPIMKLDVGNELAFKKMNHGLPQVTFDTIVSGLRSLDGIAIQSMFVRGHVDNSTDSEVESWIGRLKEINPLWVQIYSLDRGTASDQLGAVEHGRLQEIADLAEEETGLKLEVY